MTSAGRRRAISSTDFRCQQSPNLGKLLTGATSAHHLVTPTNADFAPMAQRMDVALGARETMRSFSLFGIRGGTGTSLNCGRTRRKGAR